MGKDKSLGAYFWHLGTVLCKKKKMKVERAFHGSSEPWWHLCLSKCCLYQPAPGSKEQHDHLCLSQPIFVILCMVPEGKRAMRVPVQMTRLWSYLVLCGCGSFLTPPMLCGRAMLMAGSNKKEHEVPGLHSPLWTRLCVVAKEGTGHVPCLI